MSSLQIPFSLNYAYSAVYFQVYSACYLLAMVFIPI
uniref:Uncharacterized protein n=1 Tax=Setaria italica TaxID=4555 RepID=K4A3W8_SETIT